MNCEKYRFLINKYIDNEIKEEEVDELLYHLEICEDCKLLLYDLKKLEEMTISLFNYKKNKKDYKIFVKIFLILFLVFSFKSLPLFFKNKKDENKTLGEEKSKKVYLVDFEFKDNLILK